MIDEDIYSVIRALERQYRTPAQIAVERVKEADYIVKTGLSIGTEERLFTPHQRVVYGALADRRCEVAYLPTDNLEIEHDVVQLVGIYDSIKEVNKKITAIDNIELFCALAIGEFHEGLRRHLAGKYEIKEKPAYYAHGSYADWYTVDGVEAELSNWKENRPDLFQASVQYLKDNNIPFRYNSLIATISGLYIWKEGGLDAFEDEALEEFFEKEDGLEGVKLVEKIAQVKLEFLE